jgi:WD repeat and SOF domain-containing protein 1
MSQRPRITTTEPIKRKEENERKHARKDQKKRRSEREKMVLANEQ